MGAEDDAILPAHSAIRTPHTVLSDMFLIETERGCSRGCTYCVMRRSTNGGMRIVPAERVLESIPADARRVGLVGAAVSDHPKIVSIVNALADRGCEVGLSSLRPDRLANTEASSRRSGASATARSRRRWTARASACATRSSGAHDPSTSCGAPSSRSSTAWTGSSST